MDYLQCKTKGNAKADGKPRVYLTCHPEDEARWAEKVIADLHAANDCAVFLATDMASDFAGEEWELDLGRMQLFVVPVTFRLLSEPNRAMDVDVPFALERKIPVLPIMMEPDLGELYASRFGKLQYLSPSGDNRGGGIGYKQKLGRYLDNLLVGSEGAARIRDAFDAYVFLSYRKVDRRLADDLMRTIHADPRCRDVAIWYDEFLTPGESFRENIEHALANSKLFTLLVTPNVLERPGGKPNFVMGVEYPAARDAGLDLVAAEAMETDALELESSYEGLPEPFPLWDEEAKARLLDAIARCATEANDDDPLHNYLVGLAYLAGIDVEVDAKRGVELITMAAEAGLQEAMVRLVNMFGEGDGVELDYGKAVAWAERLYEQCRTSLGENHPNTTDALAVLALELSALGDYQRAAELGEKVWRQRCETLGEENPNTLVALLNLSTFYEGSGNYQAAADLGESAWQKMNASLGEAHPNTLAALSILARSHSHLGDYQAAAKIEDKAWRLRRETLGELHPDTVMSLNNLACHWDKIGNHQKAAELGEEAWRLCRESLGDTHPNTLQLLSNIANYRSAMGDYRNAADIEEVAWRMQRKLLGEAHPSTLTSLSSLANIQRRLGNYQKAIELEERAWRLRCEKLGETHPDTILSLSNLAGYWNHLGNHQRAAELGGRALRLNREFLGEKHPNSIVSLNNLACYFFDLGDSQKAVELGREALLLCHETLGKDHPQTVALLDHYLYFRTHIDGRK